MSFSDHMVLSNFGGAMENWGLITYSYSLFDGEYRKAGIIIAHEIAHQVILNTYCYFSLFGDY